MGDSPIIITGFANQLRGISRRFSEYPYYDVNYFGWQFWGQPLKKAVFEDGSELNFKLWPNTPRSSFGQEMLPHWLKKVKPDLFFTLCDMFMIPYFREIDFAPSKVMIYYPSDGEHMPLNFRNAWDKADVIVAMSKHGQAQAKELYDYDVEYVPHGTNTNIYFPIKDKVALRQKWSKRLGIELENKFIVGTVARFQGRKMMAELFRAFADFKNIHRDSVLLLHSDPTDPANPGVEIGDLMNRYDLHGRVVWSGMRYFYGFDEATMNEVYNLMDVHALTTSGEGFGIPTIEAQSAGTPCIATDYTTTNELIAEPKTGLAIPIANEIVGTYNVYRGMVDKKKFTEGLCYLYEHRDELKKMGERGRKFVVKDYDWSVVFPMWKKLIDKTLED